MIKLFFILLILLCILFILKLNIVKYYDEPKESPPIPLIIALALGSGIIKT
jgi:hypothetical protein